MKRSSAIGCAILAAAFYALNSPMSKLLLQNVPPVMMAAFLYLGAGLGMLVLTGIRTLRKTERREHHLTKKDLPYTIGMVVLDIAAPIFLMLGLRTSTAASVSLLNNFEIVATTLIAMLIFREKIGKKLWLAIGVITVSTILLSVEDASSFQFSLGSLYVVLACICWGFENNCTRMISNSDPSEIVIIKGINSGLGSLIIALCAGEQFPALGQIALTLLLGFVAYGLSVYFYVYAQRGIGAARTSAYYAVAPFIGVALSFLFFRDQPGILFYAAFLLMVFGTWLVNQDQKASENEG